MKSAVIIVTYNGAPWIERCLGSVQEHAPDALAIVVDNASQDDTARIIASRFPFVDFIQSRENLGFGRGNNIGIERALTLGCSATMLLNQDAYLLPDTFRELQNFLEANPDVGVVSPIHCSPDEDTIDQRTYTFYLQMYASLWLCDAALGKPKQAYRIRGVNAAVWMVRCQVWLRCGGFDPLFFMYSEDDDLLSRWTDHGVKFALLPGTRAVHLRQSHRGPPPTWRQSVSRIAIRQRSVLLSLVKRPGQTFAYQVMMLVVTGLMVPFCNFLLDRNTKLLLGNWFAVVKLLFDLPTVRAHARLCSKEGAHYLNILSDTPG